MYLREVNPYIVPAGHVWVQGKGWSTEGFIEEWLEDARGRDREEHGLGAPKSQ